MNICDFNGCNTRGMLVGRIIGVEIRYCAKHKPEMLRLLKDLKNGKNMIHSRKRQRYHGKSFLLQDVRKETASVGLSKQSVL